MRVEGGDQINQQLLQRWILRLLFGLFLLGPCLAVAQEEASKGFIGPGVLGESASLATVEGPAAGDAGQDVQSLIDGLKTQWAAVCEAIQRGELRLANELISSLEAKKAELGYSSLEDYSLFLLASAEQKFSAGDREAASFLIRKAWQLSPTSGSVLIRSVRLAHLTGAGAPEDVFLRAVKALISDKEFLTKVLKGLIYPFLWALSLALYVTIVFSFCREADVILQKIARLMPVRIRGIITPFVFLMILVTPCFFSLLWCLWFWSLLIYVFIPWRRWVAFMVAVVLGLWAALIPIRENLDLRLAEQGIRTLLRASSGNYSFMDRSALQKLAADRPLDAAVHFVYGQVLRREGKYEEARRAFLRAAALWREGKPFPKVELGILAFLSGDASQADQYFSEAEAAGVRSAAFFFNYSKVKFDLMDTAASRALLAQANKNDPELVAGLQTREGTLGFRSGQSIAEISLPLKDLLPSLVASIPDAQRLHDAVAMVVMPGVRPLAISGLAMILLLGFFLVGAKERSSWRSMLYRHYSMPGVVRCMFWLVPGGAWVRMGRPAVGALLLTMILLAGMPILGWPAETRGVFHYLRGLAPYYIGIWLLLVLGVIYVGCLAMEEES